MARQPLLALTICAFLAACSDEPKTMQTTLAGHFTAGGSTSGEVIARTPGDTRVSPSPEGTPGIPQGSGGNTDGAEMGGTSDTEQGGAGDKQQAQGRQDGGEAGQGRQTSAAGTDSAQDEKAKKEAAAERQKQELAEAMERVASRWQELAAANNWNSGNELPAGVQEGFRGQPSQTAGGQLLTPIRSEKHGTAPPSEDVKQPAAGARVQ